LEIVMKLVKLGDATMTLRSYNVWPKRGNQPDGFTVKVDGKSLPTDDVRKTGGGKFPVYTYLKLDGKIYYFQHDTAKDAELSVVLPAPVVAAPAPAPAAEAPAPAVVAAPAPAPAPAPEVVVKKRGKK
jgi:hypothetical protein